VFFRQERVGRGGESFRVWKFRSMVQGADAKIADARRDADQQHDVFYKSASDSRVTPIGRFIRKTSIDELPQLFNVLSGTMSLVGPRPLVPGEGAEVGNFLERRMLVRPGITGLWQVSGRSDVPAEERIRMDFYYVENWSVAGDLLIMGQTVRSVLSRRGAY
jgi:lipopolysaccharide/colanic/teichoic acid biosynthesis glycosyltransferase